MKSSMKFPSYVVIACNLSSGEKPEDSSVKSDKSAPAMTNDQPTIMGQASGPEPHHLAQHQQENVQLTELLPVEQSRIKDNPGDRDQEATDGLKALRSFAAGDLGHYESQRDADCFGKLVVPIEDTRSPENALSGSRKRKSGGKSCNGGGNAKAARLDGGGSTSDLKFGRARKNGKKIADGAAEIDSATGEAEVDGEGTDRLKSVRDEYEDEVYDFRQTHLPEPGDADRESGDEIWSMNLEILSAGVYRDMANNFSGTGDPEGPANSGKIGGAKKRKKVDKPPEKEKTNEKVGKKQRSSREKVKVKRKTDADAGNSPDDSATILAEAEKDLRLKVDGIIQANFYLERENNNLVRASDNEIDKMVESAAPETSRRTKKNAAPENSSRTKSKDDPKQHVPQDETKKYNCVMCSSRFKGSGGLRNHYKVMHAAGPLYKCDECGKEFPLKERLKLHVRTHTGFKPYKCPDCPKSFARGGQLAQHRGTHTKVKPYCCNLCMGTFTCAANLALHIKRHNGQKDHKCEICGRGFVRKDALKKHLECLHRDVKSFLCVICNKTFKGHLPQHMRTHAQDRPHGCATCGQRFAQKSQLTVHQRTHSGQRPFRCLVCWQAFAHSTALKLHTRRHTGERPFKCVECNAGFTQLPHWKKHMKCIHGRTEPYSCKICHSFFRIKNDLESHEKSCHVNDVVDELDKEKSSPEPANSRKNVVPSPEPSKFRAMTVERMRLLLAVLLKRISKPQRLDELGFGKRLIDEVLQDSLVAAGKEPARIGELTVLECLRKNLESFLEWTVPKEHWDMFRKMKKSPEEILETLTTT